MPYDMHGGGHGGESRLYCPRKEVKFSEEVMFLIDYNACYIIIVRFFGIVIKLMKTIQLYFTIFFKMSFY